MTLITTPTGRLVYGHPSVKVQKKDQKKQPVFNKEGKPVMIHSFGVAYTKADFSQFLWPVMWSEASALYGGGQPPQHFAFKYKDGDGIDRQGKPYNTRAGYAGCMIVHFETQFDLLAYRQNPAGGWMQITEKEYKTGDYIAVSVEISGNKPTDPQHTPSLYVNPQGVLLIGIGDAIINAPSADQMFSGQQFALPPGATAPGAMPNTPAGYPQQPAAPGYPQQPAAPGYQPAPDFVQNAMGQQPATPMPGAIPPYPAQR